MKVLNRLRTRALALAVIAALALPAALPAAATDDDVTFSAGGCSGYGYSFVSFGYGATETGACSGSERYLAGSIVHVNSCSEYASGQWFSYDVQMVPNPALCGGTDVDAVAGNHALRYGGSQSSIYGTLAT